MNIKVKKFQKTILSNNLTFFGLSTSKETKDQTIHRL